MTPQESNGDGEPVEEVEPLDFCQVMPEPFPAIGRICCDAAEGRLNAMSIMLQGSQVSKTTTKTLVLFEKTVLSLLV